MLKKLLILSLVAVMLSTAAFANGVLLAEATYAAIVEVENNATISEETGLEGTVTLNLASTEARESALLITAVYDESGSMLNAEINSEVSAVVAGDNEVTIELPSAKTNENNKYIVKFFWWESKASLVPVVECASITVLPPAPETPATWSGLAATEAPDQDANGYYLIENGEDLAWFSNKVDEAPTVKAKLVNDIYLNWFDADANGEFDENWYETAANVEAATSWKDYMILGFKGELDGNTWTIYGLYVKGVLDSSTSGIGFFSKVSGGTVKDITFKGAYIVSTATTSSNTPVRPASVVCGASTGTTSTFSGISTYGKIVADSGKYLHTAGSIVGKAGTTDSCVTVVSLCYSEVDIDARNGGTTVKTSGNIGVGGIVGTVSTEPGYSLSIDNCTNRGKIIIPYSCKAGGILGNALKADKATTIISNCKNYGDIRYNKSGGQIYGYKNSGYSVTTSNNVAEGSSAVFSATEVID